MMDEMKNAYKIFLIKPEGKRPLQDICIDGRITTLKCILWTYGGCRVNSSGSKQGPVTGSCVQRN
jgi:hypothetical protein